MSVTLSKFGVPLQGGFRKGLSQPNMKFRFRVLMTGFGGAGDNSAPITFETNRCGRPNMQHEVVKIHGYNSQGHYLGKPTWQPVDLTVRSTIDTQVDRIIVRQQQKQFDHYNQIGPRAASNYKFNMRIQTLDGSEDTYLNEWLCEGCSVASVNFGELDYSDSNPVEIQMTIEMDNAIFYGEGGGLISESLARGILSGLGN